MVTKTVKVHYFYDPMCGWCYGATALIEALAECKHIEVLYHPGGMIKQQAITPDFRAHIIKSDKNITKITGATFGEVYIARLKGSDDLVFDSYIMIRAILVAEKMGISALHMLKSIQEAHFLEGKQVALMSTLNEIAISQGLDKTTWITNMEQFDSREEESIKITHELMNQYHIHGYPSLVAEASNGLHYLAYPSYYQDIKGWKNMLSMLH